MKGPRLRERHPITIGQCDMPIVRLPAKDVTVSRAGHAVDAAGVATRVIESPCMILCRSNNNEGKLHRRRQNRRKVTKTVVCPAKNGTAGMAAFAILTRKLPHLLLLLRNATSAAHVPRSAPRSVTLIDKTSDPIPFGYSFQTCIMFSRDARRLCLLPLLWFWLWFGGSAYASLGDRLPEFRECVRVRQNLTFVQGG